jgi:hypothetical protein
VPDLNYVWNIEGHENNVARAREMITQAQSQIYLALLPKTFPYLPQILALLGEQALEIIQEEDRALFARALESHTQ